MEGVGKLKPENLTERFNVKLIIIYRGLGKMFNLDNFLKMKLILTLKVIST